MDTLRWDDLPVFLAIARRGTLSAAAAELGVNVSTAQRRLGTLEAALGCRLFDRSPAGLALTPSGEALVPLAEAAEEQVIAIACSIAGRDQAPRGPVHLTAPEPLLDLLVEPLASFRVAYPRIDLRVSFADRYFDLARREADVAVRPSPSPPEDAVGRRVAGVAWAVYAGARTPSRGAEPLPWAAYSDDLGRLAAARHQARHHGDEPVLLTVNSVSAMQRVVRCTPCRAYLPCFAGDADPQLVRLSEPMPEAGSALWLLVHPDLRRAARVRALLDHLWDALRERRCLFEGDEAR